MEVFGRVMGPAMITLSFLLVVTYSFFTCAAMFLFQRYEAAEPNDPSFTTGNYIGVSAHCPSTRSFLHR